MHMSIHMSIYISVNRSPHVYPRLHISVHTSRHMSVHIAVHMSVHISERISGHISTAHCLGWQHQIDVLLNNAGRSQRDLADATSLDVDRQQLELNTLGTVNTDSHLHA